MKRAVSATTTCVLSVLRRQLRPRTRASTLPAGILGSCSGRCCSGNYSHRLAHDHNGTSLRVFSTEVHLTIDNDLTF